MKHINIPDTNNTDMDAKNKKTGQAKSKNGDLIEFLKEKKARVGKLSKVGEWLLANDGNTGWYITEGSMKYILK